MHRRVLLTAGAAAMAAGQAQAQAYPNRSLRMVMPYAPGGATDAVARFFAQMLTTALQQNVVVENRSGGSGAVGGSYVMRAAPDGYTLLFNASVHVISPLLARQPAFDPVQDFAPVSLVARGPLLFICHPSITATSLPELAAQIRANPDRFTFCTSSCGSAGHLAEELFKQLTGTDVLVAPYNGSAMALSDLAAGRVNLMIDPILSSLPFVRDGRARALALTSATRAVVAPEIPTVAEAGMPDLEFYSWYGVWGPKELPAELKERLGATLLQAARSDQARAFLSAQGFEPAGLGPRDFAAFIDREVARYRAIITRANIQPD